ncbi:hypothetical protein B0H14DRAFT_395061 [Mycena olivaceomarginata]|nr:hypothetical protein B0H14DRAFT_395061 [Mycena olivaceomarginata]
MGRFWKAALLAVVWLKLDLNNPVFKDISDASLWEAEMAAAVWVLLDLSVWKTAVVAALWAVLHVSFWKVAIVSIVTNWPFLSSGSGSPKSTFLLMGRFWKAALLAVVWLNLDLNNPVFEDISDASLWEAEMAAAVWVLLDLSVWTVAITAVLSGLLDISFWKVAIVCAVNDWLFLSSGGGSPKSTSPREKGDYEPESYRYLESSYPSRQFETAYRSNPSYGSSYSALSNSTFRNRWYGEEWPYHESRALVPPYSSSREVILSSAVLRERKAQRIESITRPGDALLLDLHGLFVRDAKIIVKTTILEAERMNRQSEDWSEVHFIVGKGRHSFDGISKLKPALTTYISQELSRAVVSDPNNDGRIIVSLGSNAVPWNRFKSWARP